MWGRGPAHVPRGAPPPQRKDPMGACPPPSPQRCGCAVDALAAMAKKKHRAKSVGDPR